MHELTKNGKVWSQFARFTIGQKGPFAKVGDTKKAAEISPLCDKLWPLGPPTSQDLWYAMIEYDKADYVLAVDSLFGRTVPIPISSRWYDLIPR